MVTSKNKKRLLITGVSGLLGNNLAYYFRDKYEVVGIYLLNKVEIKGIYTDKCDLQEADSIQRIVTEFAPSIIIHCASLTNIDQCENDKDLTANINISATENIVKSVPYKDTKLIYISSDSVYDGVKGNFSENDTINPQNYYGISKYEGEKEVLEKENSLILRTNLFGWNILDKSSIAEWILYELMSGKQIKCFRDAVFSSIYTFELARVIDIAIRKDLKGVYNCGSADSCSKYDFAVKIAGCFGLDKKLIIPISIDDFEFKAKRGKNLSLNVNKIQNYLDYRLPTIDHCIEVFYRNYKCELPEEIKHIKYKSSNQNGIIPYGRQWLDENDIQAVANVLRSQWLTQGPNVDNFEKALAKYCGADYAVVMNSATSALHAACLAAGVERGDEAITSPITFVASANCVVYCSAKPVFGDIDPKTYNILPKEIQKKTTHKTKAVIPVHFAGQSCDMESIQKIVVEAEKKYGHKIYIIEDACHALGSLYKDKKVGSCTFSDMTVMSFHPVKHITTGEGGVVLTNDITLYKKMKKIRSHGITNNPDEFINADLAYSQADHTVNPWYYEQIVLGYNYRITNIQCALGLSQLKKLEMFRSRRREIINYYNEAFKSKKHIIIPHEDKTCDSNFHLYVLLFDFEKIGLDRAQFMRELQKREIQTQVHYMPVYLHSFYQQHFGTKTGDCLKAEEYYMKCLSIPLFPAMRDEDVDRVIKEVTDIVDG